MNATILREKLRLAKQEVRFRNRDDLDDKQKKKIIGYIKEEGKTIKAQEKVEKIQKKISDESYVGRSKRALGRVEKGIERLLSGRAKYRKGKKSNVVVVENQPVYSRDKNRYFKTAWEEEKKQLFFS